MKSASFLSSLFHNLPVVNLIFDVERFLRRSIVPTLLGYQALRLGETIGCSRMGPEVALQTLNRKFGEFLFRTLSMDHVLGM